MKHEPVRVLFVCLGNICRSPAAQAVMEHLVREQGLEANLEVDSAGLLDSHKGEDADPRIRIAGTRRGYRFEHHSRPVTPQDFDRFQYIVAMDSQVLAKLRSMSNGGRPSPPRLSLIMQHAATAESPEVPDPYWGNAADFENVMDLVEAGCAGLLENLRKTHGLA